MVPSTRRRMTMTATKRRRSRRRGHIIEPHPRATCIGVGLLGFAFLFVYFLWKVQDLLDSTIDHGFGRSRGGVRGIERSIFRRSSSSSSSSSNSITLRRHQSNYTRNSNYDNGIITYLETNYVEKRPAPDRFLVFQPIGSGQGQGNIVAGLLAAHLLADEFNRVVCVSPSYNSFLSVFQPIHPWTLEKCNSDLIPIHNHRKYGKDTIRLVTFEKPPNECALQHTLQNGPDILFLIANTYPRWPKVPTNYFFRFYRPKPELLNKLPYDVSPRTVVHLREGDGPKKDQRKGTDDLSLNALGQMLPSDTFLVTNRVEWYDMFSQKYGWSNPGWDGVTHSALGKSWGVRGKKFEGATNSRGAKASPDQQRLQLWSDWYTILTASKVYHSHSDFSVSAVHWVGSSSDHSQVLLNYDDTNHRPGMAAESYIVEGETPPLKDRSLDAKGTRSELRLCNSNGGFVSRIKNHFGVFDNNSKEEDEDVNDKIEDIIDDNI